MERQYSQELLAALTKKENTVEENGLPILVKPIPDLDAPGVLDPRVYASIAPQFKGIKGALMKSMMKGMAKKDKKIDPEQMRKMMNGIKSIPIVDTVAVNERSVRNGDVSVPIRIYVPEKPGAGGRPVFYFIHGGGFVAGRFEVVEEFCKLMVEKTDCPAVSVGYRLAPENPYPAGLDDCFAVLEWIYENAAQFGGDGEKICVAGDSAGGNFATVCAMKDRDNGTHMVKVQALLYPTVDMAGIEDANLHFDINAYSIAPEQKSMIQPMLEFMKAGMGGKIGETLGVEDDSIPYLSPYLGDLTGLPPCIILFGEFDFLRLECEAYARKLQRAGVEVKAVRYSGMSHAFADMVGVQPQAEDCAQEIAGFMLAHLPVDDQA